MGVKIVFGIMSAVAKRSVVEQLIDTLGPHQILVHHDFSQQPDFPIDRPNVAFVPDPSRTGWGTWGHTTGIFKMLRHAVDHYDFDYFQLLSPSCLPIRPIGEFERYIANGQHEANNVYMDLFADSQEYMHFAYRTFAPKGSLRYRAMRRIRNAYFGDHEDVEERANLQIRTGYDGMEAGRPSLKAHLARTVTRVLASMPGHPFGPQFRPMMGDIWFGVRPHVARYMLERFHDPVINGYFSQLDIAEELLIASILGNSGFRIGPANHYVNTYIKNNPRWLEPGDLSKVRASGKFFGRKFPNDPEAEVRRGMLASLHERVPSTTVSTAT